MGARLSPAAHKTDAAGDSRTECAMYVRLGTAALPSREGERMSSIAICNTKIGPYHVARIRALANLIPEVLAVEIAGKEALYPWWDNAGGGEIRKVTLCPGGRYESIPVKTQVAELQALLEREQPRAVVVDGYSEPVMQAAARWARRHRRLSVLLFISWAGDKPRFAPKEWGKSLLLRGLFDAVCVGGELQLAYARQLGFDERRIWKLSNVIDNDHFSHGARDAREHAKALRAHWQLPAQYFLYVGRYERWKNLPTLLHAYHRYREHGGFWELALVGSGQEEPSLRQLVEQQQIPGVHWLGPRPYQELPIFYALASCFVLPSRSEPWGLVVNEAEACGLPILASTRCGCIPELVQRGINGYTFSPTDTAELTRLMLKMSSDQVDLYGFGVASQQIVNTHTPDRWARALADCLNHDWPGQVRVTESAGAR